MTPARLLFWGTAAALFLLVLAGAPDADADPVPVNPIVPAPSVPFGGEPGIGTGPGIDSTSPNLSPAAATIFLCPGIGGAANVFGGGGGYCDFNFQPVRLSEHHYGIMHIHCEWGGFAPIIEMWNCWRVFPGQPDHPGLPDPDIIPDGWGVPWAIRGPSPGDQWPPPGLAPAPQLTAPPETAPPEGLPGPPPPEPTPEP